MQPLRYRIGADAAPAIPGCTVEAPYGVAPPPGGIWYCNCNDQTGTGDYGPYADISDTAKQYGELVPDVHGPGWLALTNAQIAHVPAGDCVEWDNIDAYPLAAVLELYDRTWARGVRVAVKNPGLVKGGQALVAHPAAALIIVEKDAGTPDEMHAMRVAAGKPDLPVRFVAFGGGREWARTTAATIRAHNYPDMGVTYDAAGEYGGDITDILIPSSEAQPMPEPAAVTGAQILAEARKHIGEFSDGPDVPQLAQYIAHVFPDLAAYCRNAGPDTAWCGIYVAYVMAHFGIRPPHGDDGTGGFMWVDAWLNWGTPVDPSDAQPGDVAIFLGSPHHVSICAGNGKYCGGNQGPGVVNEERIRVPNHVRRAPSTIAAPAESVITIAKPAGQFDRCVAFVLADEGGNDDDPRDPGGRTSRGITEREWQAWTSTHAGLPSDVWQAPQASVLAIYRQNYWDALWCDKLPAGVDHAVFDYGVNSGIGRSARVLQGIVGAEVDGEIGPETVGKTVAKDPAAVINALCDERMAFLRGLSTWGTFGRGWTTRVTGVRAHALAMVGATPAAPVAPVAHDPLPPVTTPPPPTVDFATLTRRIEQLTAELRAHADRLATLEHAKMTDTPTPVAPPKADPAAVTAHLDRIEKLVEGIAAHPPQQSPMYDTVAKLVSAIPNVGVYSSVIAYALVAVLQSVGVIGAATPTASGVTAGIGATFAASLFSKINQWFKPKS
jgi:lysozyme family protein